MVNKIQPIFEKKKARNELAFLQQFQTALDTCARTLLKYPKYKATGECVSVLHTHSLLVQNEIERYKKLLEDSNEPVDEI